MLCIAGPVRLGKRPRRNIERAAPTPPPPPFIALVTLQRADGSWELTAEFAEVIGLSLDAIEQDMRGAIGRPADIRLAWATALALAWLRDHAAAFEN